MTPGGPTPLSPTADPSVLAALKAFDAQPAAPSDSLAALASLAGADPSRLAPTSLPYDVHACSSYSANYQPQKIKESVPTDQSSRWSTAHNNQNQFITLRLDRPAIVQSITFGKYHKPHVCNLKEFKVFGGLTDTNSFELLHAGLRNDAEPETFSLKHRANGILFPCQFIQIRPLAAHGPNFNYSIWSVELRGVQDARTVDRCRREYTNYRETQALRLCLKYFRQRGMLDQFTALQQRTGVRLEDPALTELHRCLVVDADFPSAERLLTSACASGLFTHHVSSIPYAPVWRRVHHQAGTPWPSQRGGHQMCVDIEGRKVYVFGGWDGGKELADLWRFDIESGTWTCLSNNTGRAGGPSPRSCHKICWDPVRRCMWLTGRFVETESPPARDQDRNEGGDFWRWDAATEGWARVSGDTAADGGPDLIFDHQMCLDHDRGVLYVFGGKSQSPRVGATSGESYSGLFAYHIGSRRWTLLRDDGDTRGDEPTLRSRIGHSMLFDPVARELVVFAGQRSKEYLSDMYTYSVDRDIVSEVARDYSKTGGPDAGFTQRATLDAARGEVFVLSGLTREKNSAQETVKNSFWVYKLREGRWDKVYQNGDRGGDPWAIAEEPVPRFASQMVLEERTGKHYMFGGNPGEQGNPNARLDDLWELNLTRPDDPHILRRARFSIRAQRFREMCRAPGCDTVSALRYLQTDVAECVDHSDAAEGKEFRELTGCLFGGSGIGGMVAAAGGLDRPSDDIFAQRTALYEKLVALFPERMREPVEDLAELVPMS